METNLFIAFFLTSVIASLIPGPSMILALTHGIKYKRYKTIFSAMGNTCASIIQAGVSAAGLGALLVNSYSIFLVIKILGAFYLIFMGISMLKSQNFSDVSNIDRKKNLQNPKQMFYQGFIVAASNPKAIVFFTALFPQFISLESNKNLQLLILVITIGFVAFFSFMLYAVAGEKLIKIINFKNFQAYVFKCSAVVFILSGLGILVECRR